MTRSPTTLTHPASLRSARNASRLGRFALLALITITLVTSTVPLAASAQSTTSPHGKLPSAPAAQDAFLALKANALGRAPPQGAPQDPVAHLEGHVLSRSHVESEDVRETWERAANANATRLHVLQAEVALLDLARRHVHHSLEEANTTTARAWLQVVLTRVDQPLPHDASAQGPEELREALHAALAARAREEALASVLLHRAGHDDAAEDSAHGAGALGALLLPDAVDRLPTNLQDVYRGNVSDLPQRARDVHEPGEPYLLEGFLAPLVALQRDHDPEPLEVWALRNVDAAHAAARATAEDPALSKVLGEQALIQYNGDRGRLALAGEGTVQNITDADDAYLRLRNATRHGDGAGAVQAAEDVRHGLADTALLMPGSLLRVEWGGVQPDITHRYRVTLTRPSLEGVHSMGFHLAWDPTIVQVLDVEANHPHVTVANLALEGDRLQGEVTASPPLNESAYPVVLVLERAPGASAGDETNLTVSNVTVTEADGDPHPLFKVRRGHVTIAGQGDVTPDEGVDPKAQNGNTSSTPNQAPAPTGIVPLLLGALLLAWRQRR